MKKIKRALRFLFRPDVFNRIMVFLTLCFIIVIPSMVLYQVQDFNNSIEVVLPSLFLLASSLGIGCISIYRPSRTGWFFFFECLTTMLIFGKQSLKPDSVIYPVNPEPFFIISIILLIAGFGVNLFYLLYFLRAKKRLKSEFNEETSHDDFFHFLSGDDHQNKVIEQKADKIQFGEKSEITKLMKIKFSSLVRIASAIIMVVAAFFQLIKLTSAGTDMYICRKFLFLLLIFIPLCVVASILYPKNFKYLYFFLGFVLLIAVLTGDYQNILNDVILIIEIILLALALIVTMIAEGRTWSGGGQSSK